ncbi:hypothetical protein OIU84_000751 [Salix udensis]|uniref:Uncharacterized protein n=1 Tax=Salix udensis TaxID=889485 RepID=A0AAD6PPB4_9ROSI|nr:hypothetical protein OIU84_000751 [Salix udensis]
MAAENLLFLDPFDKDFLNFLSSCSSCKHHGSRWFLLIELPLGFALEFHATKQSLCRLDSKYHSYVADMNQMKNVFPFLLFTLLLLSHSLPGSAVKIQFDEAPTKPQLPQGRHNGLISSFQTPKLGVYVRKRGRFVSTS